MIKSSVQATSNAVVPESLYERLLGHEAARLPAPVAAVHCGTGESRVEGWLRVDRGTGWLCRLVATAARLPRPGRRVRTRLVITRGHDACGQAEERWLRQFGDAAAVCSKQVAGPTGDLVELFGPLAFVFRLAVVGEALCFHQRACRLRLGRLALPLPLALAPQVTATVGPAPNGGVTVSVRVDTRWSGLLLGYEGTVVVQEGLG